MLFTLAVAMLAACSTQPPQVPPRFVYLEGPEAEPYASMAMKARQRLGADIYLSARAKKRLDREIHGLGYRPAFDPPEIPCVSLPGVFRDTLTGRTFAWFTFIGTLGCCEIAFTRSSPPKVTKIYFTDYKRTVRFPSVEALYRYYENKASAAERAAALPSAMRSKVGHPLGS